MGNQRVRVYYFETLLETVYEDGEIVPVEEIGDFIAVKLDKEAEYREMEYAPNHKPSHEGEDWYVDCTADQLVRIENLPD